MWPHRRNKIRQAILSLSLSLSLSLHTFSFSQPGKQKKKFSSFFKSLVIELDKELYGPDNHLVEVWHHFKNIWRELLESLSLQLCTSSTHVSEWTSSNWTLFQWHRMPTTQETDGFQVKRPGDVNVKCTLLFMLDHQVPLRALWHLPSSWMTCVPF